MPGVAEFRRGERTSMRSDSDLSSELAETRRRLAELEAAEADRRDAETIQGALYRIAELASAAQDMQEFYGAVHAVVGELMYADNFFIALFDEERQLINWPYWEDEVDVDWPAANTWVDFGSRQSRGTTAYVLRTGEPQWLPRERQEELIAQGEFELWGEMSEDWLGVPLTSEGRTVGALVVQSYTKEFTYTEQDKELLAYVGQHVGAALSRARAIEETRQRVAELATVNSVGQAVAAQLDLDALIELVGERVRETFDADIAYVALLDEATGADRVRLLQRRRRAAARALDRVRRGAHLANSRVRRAARAQPIRAVRRARDAAGGNTFPLVPRRADRRRRQRDRRDQRPEHTRGGALQRVRLGPARHDRGERRRRDPERAPLRGTARRRAAVPGPRRGAAPRRLHRTSPMRPAPQLAFPCTSAREWSRFSATPLDAWLEEGFTESVLLPEDRESTLARTLAHLEAGDERWSIEYRVRAADGRVVWVRDDAWIVRDEQGTPTHLQGFMIDITARVEAAAELDRQKQYFESLVEISPVAIVVMDADERVTGWNPAAAELFGYSPEEAIGRLIDDLVVGGDLREEGRDVTREALEAGRAHRITRRWRKDGTLVDVQMMFVPLRVDGEHVGFYAIYHDITELQRAREHAETVLAVTQVLGKTLSLRDTIETILTELQRVVPYDSCSVQVIQGNRLVIVGGTRTRGSRRPDRRWLRPRRRNEPQRPGRAVEAATGLRRRVGQPALCE